MARSSWVPIILLAVSTIAACGGNSNSPPPPPPSITAPASPLAAGTVGTVYSSVTFASSGAAPITWSVTSGSLPPGMMLSTTGTYSGTPSAAGTFSFTVTASNAGGADSDPYMHAIAAPAPNANVLLLDSKLAAFSTIYPAGIEAPATLTGVAAGEVLVSIDRRPQNGFLYGLGYNATLGTVQLYAVHSTSGVATAVGTAGSFVDGAGLPARIGVDTSTRFGIDFNPTVDRVRVVNSAGQNFRINPNSGAVVDGDLGGAAASVVGINMDGAVNGATTGVQETAYTSNVQNATVTTQYTLDQTIDALCIQNPPNAGTQTGCLTFSSAADTVLGFDIAPGVSATAANTAVTSGSGFGVLKLAGQTNEVLAQVNLVSGAISGQTTIGTGGILGLALQLPPSTPMVALAVDGGSLLRFYSGAPATVVTVAVTGVTAGEVLAGIDYRPQTGQLHGLGVNGTADTATLYRIDPQTGVATPIGTAGQIAFVDAASAPVDLPAASAGYGVDFNPAVDRLRIVAASGLNFRVNPITGAPVDGNTGFAGINPDGAINGATTSVDGAAYTNSFGNILTGATTTLYTLDAQSNGVYIQSPPNNGTEIAFLPVTLSGAALDFVAAGGFDISSDVRSGAADSPVSSGSAFAALSVAGTTRLYSINLVTGVATDLGLIGAGTTSVAGLAAGQTAVR